MVEFYTTVRVTGSRQASGPRRMPPEPTRRFRPSAAGWALDSIPTFVAADDDVVMPRLRDPGHQTNTVSDSSDRDLTLG
jgi:hypothetical protein